MTAPDKVFAPPADLTFTPSNSALPLTAAIWTKVPDDYFCRECRERGGWMPKIDQSDCPACSGSDPYGEPSYCGECEYCCGC